MTVRRSITGQLGSNGATRFILVRPARAQNRQFIATLTDNVLNHYLTRAIVFVTTICIVATFADKATFWSAPILGVLIGMDKVVKDFLKITFRDFT